MLFKAIITQIEALDTDAISVLRKNSLQSIINYIKHKADHDKPIQLNFICTHNSRRSHLSQVWAQALALYFNIKRVYCYSGGTETMAFYPATAEALESSGFKIESQPQGINPLHKIKYAENQVPIMGFSKTHDDDSNPKSDFAAI
ncbi:MAG: protein-tyrosine-phosphatase, partial [Bacteroidota bacterium]|nr:protein-tyrosine-phosphatase [Bacteroidota bacterium]